MTAKELIKELKKYPEDTKVYLWAGNWITEHQGEVKTARMRYDICDDPRSIERKEGLYLSHV